MRSTVLAILAAAAFAVPTAGAKTKEVPFVCKKDGEPVKLKAKAAKDKKKECEEQGATWEQAAAEAAPKAEEQKSGSGGGW